MPTPNRSVVATVFLLLLLGASIPLGLVNATNSQAPNLQWTKTYGHYFGYSVIQTYDEGYVIAGQNAVSGMRGYNNFEPSVIKTDSSGQVEWLTIISSGGYAISVAQTKDLGYAIGCNPNGLLVKLDSKGGIQWNRTFGLTSCYVIQTSEGSYAIAGSQRNSENGDNAVLIKTAGNGDKLWNKTFNFGFSTWVTTFIQTNDGGYALSGETNWFAKTDANGNLLWNQTYELPSTGKNIAFSQIANTNDGGFILTGFAINGAGALLLKTDPKGDIEWSKQYENASFASIIQDSDGGYVAAGVDQSGNYALIKLDTLGKILWNVSIAGNPSSVIRTNDGAYVVTGTRSSSGGRTDIFLAKLSLESASTMPTAPSDETIPSPLTAWIILAIIITVVIVTSLLVYLKKYK